MDPVTMFLIPGLVAGLVFAWFLLRRHRESDSQLSAERGIEWRSSDVINIAHIRVAGVGGLGLVAMALVVALAIPRIGQQLGVASVLGAVLAAALILWRRRSGPLPSSGRRAGANTTLSIDAPRAASERKNSTTLRAVDVEPLPASR